MGLANRVSLFEKQLEEVKNREQQLRASNKVSRGTSILCSLLTPLDPLAFSRRHYVMSFEKFNLQLLY